LELIPIVVMDAERSSYGVEWVLMLNITHRCCDVGLALRFDSECHDSWTASALYLDKAEVVGQHFLVGLAKSCCGHLRPFSLRRLKFKSHAPDAATPNDARQVREMLSKYKQGFEQLEMRASESSELYHARSQQIEALKVAKQQMTQQLRFLKMQRQQNLEAFGRMMQLQQLQHLQQQQPSMGVGEFSHAPQLAQQHPEMLLDAEQARACWPPVSTHNNYYPGL